MDEQNNSNSEELVSHQAPCAPHTPIRVTNLSKSLYDPNLKISSDEPRNQVNHCFRHQYSSPTGTPTKQPARAVFKKNEPISKDSTASSGDASFMEFLARVKLAQQQDAVYRASTLGQPSSYLPEYARYQEALFHHKVHGQEIACNGLPRSPSMSSPGAEWVADRPISAQSSNSTIQRSWDEETLVRQHAFPASIFNSAGKDGVVGTPIAGGISMNPSKLQGEPAYSNQSNVSDSSPPGATKHRSQSASSAFLRDGSISIPSAATLSSGSSSSWSQEEKNGVRKFLALLERTDSFRNTCSMAGLNLPGLSVDIAGQIPAPIPPAAETHLTPLPISPSPPMPAQAVLNNNISTMVEITPGVNEPLRNADETVRAVRHDFYVPVSCFGCSEDIFCIADAKYVICPSCRIISPIEEDVFDGNKLNQHGLGLGFSCESLFQLQSEILSEQR